MAKTIVLTLPAGEQVYTGKMITFKAPCDCVDASSLSINGESYALFTAGLDICGSTWAAFKSGAMVTVSIQRDEFSKRAYIINSDYVRNAGHAASADFADKASFATRAQHDYNGDVIHQTYAKLQRVKDLEAWQAVIQTERTKFLEAHELKTYNNPSNPLAIELTNDAAYVISMQITNDPYCETVTLFVNPKGDSRACVSSATGVVGELTYDPGKKSLSLPKNVESLRIRQI